MQTPFRNFASSFSTEDHLRQCLRILFSKMPGVRGVEVTHGSQELGKDIIFYVPNFLGKMELYACVVKLKKVDGTVSKTGAREVLTQALQAFDSPHLNTEGQEDHVTKVFIISPFDCPPATMTSIKGALKSRAGQVQFLCGHHLMDEFAKYWQDFLLFESSALNTYVASIAKHLVDKDPVHFILKAQQLLGGELESLESRYVDQDLKKAFHGILVSIDVRPLTSEAFSGRLTIGDMRAELAQLRALLPLLESPTLTAGFTFEDHRKRVPNGNSQDAIVPASEDLSLKRVNDRKDHWISFVTPLDEFNRSQLLQAAGESSKDLLEEWQGLSNEAQKKMLGLRMDRKTWDADQINTNAFSLSGAWYQRYQAQLQAACGLLSSFEELVESVNTYTDARSGNDIDLFGPAYSAHSYIEDVVREAPGFFAKDKSVKYLHLQRTKLLANRRANYLITAPAGYGKTSFCKIHAIRDAVALTEQKSTTIPVYVPLSSFATASIRNDSVFLDLSELQGIMTDGDPAKRHWTFYLDGLDEVADRQQRSLLMDCARCVLQKLPLSQIIVTSRTYISGPELAWLTRIELAELEREDVELLANKWLSSDELVNSFCEQLKSSAPLARLCRVPLLATLTLAVFKKDPSLPKNKAALYKTFTELLCGGWDYVKGVNRDSHFGRHDKLRILIRFAGILHMNKLTNGSERELKRAIADVHSELLPSFSRLRDELIEDGLVQSAGNDLVFSHLSFQEYLASLEFGDPSGDRSNALLLGFFRGDDWWREVIAFYVAGPHRPDEMERWVTAGARKVETSIFNDGGRKKFLITSIEEAFPGWKPTLI